MKLIIRKVLYYGIRKEIRRRIDAIAEKQLKAQLANQASRVARHIAWNELASNQRTLKDLLEWIEGTRPE